MSDTIFLEKCKSYIDCHLNAGYRHGDQAWKQPPTITVSRQTGAGGLTTAELLAQWLESHAPRSGCPWTVFHKNLVQKVLEDNDLPARLAQFMPEDKVSSVADAVEEILGLHPASWKLVRKTTETILQLAELGQAIFVGRGANVITRRLQNAMHVRLVGGLERRTERIMDLHKINQTAAEAFIKKSDAGRKRYVRRYYGENIEDPLLYHWVLNTDFLSESEAAELIGLAVLRKFYRAEVES